MDSKKHNKEMNYDEKCQILVIGNSEVGKTSLLIRYTKNNFTMQHLATIGIDHFTKDEEINGLNIRIKVWDTAGQERYKSLASSFFRNVQGIILVYDVSNKESFDDLKIWLDSIKSNLGADNTVKKIIIGNKIDLEREVTKDEAEMYCHKLKIDYYETSAKENVNVRESFLKLVHLILGSKLDEKKESLVSLTLRPSNVNSSEENSKKCNC